MAAHSRVVVAAGALFDQAVSLSIGGVQVEGQRSVARSGPPNGPGSVQRFPPRRAQLVDMALPEAA